MNDLFRVRNYLAWIAVCTVSPILRLLAMKAGESEPDSLLPSTGVIGSVLLILLAIPLLQWRALRRFAVKLTWWIWIPTHFFAMMLWIALMILDPLHMNMFGREYGDAIATTGAALHNPGVWRDIAWRAILNVAIINMLGYTLLPSLVLAWRAQLRWHAFFCAGASGIIAVILAKILCAFGGEYPISFYPASIPSGHQWGSIASFAIDHALLGAIDGATACTVLALFSRREAPGIEMGKPLMLLGGAGLLNLAWHLLSVFDALKLPVP